MAVVDEGSAQPSRPEFEVASVKPATPLTTTGEALDSLVSGGPGTADPGQLTCRNMALKDLFLLAYRIKTYQISGPAWLSEKKYDIAAKISRGTTKAQADLMLQNLLVERLEIKLHHETRHLPGYELVIARTGLRMGSGKPGQRTP